jgi:hypothetical protein
MRSASSNMQDFMAGTPDGDQHLDFFSRLTREAITDLALMAEVA